MMIKVTFGGAVLTRGSMRIALLVCLMSFDLGCGEVDKYIRKILSLFGFCVKPSKKF